MNRRSFLRNVAGVLAGALGAGWLWSRKAANQMPPFHNWHLTKRGSMEQAEVEAEMASELAKWDIEYVGKEDAVCVVLQRHLSKRVWPPYAVRVFNYYDQYGVAIGDGNWDTGVQYHFTFSPDETGPGCARMLDRRFDEGFKCLREIVAKGSLKTGAQA